MENWKVVYVTGEPYLAEMARQVLGDNGIEAVIMDKKDSAYPVIGQIEVMVKRDDLEAAQQLINEFGP
jgi:hypothetical protein